VHNWEIARFGHASQGKGNTRINNEIRKRLSRNRITLSLRRALAGEIGIQPIIIGFTFDFAIICST
jgi:hypothetical protein